MLAQGWMHSPRWDEMLWLMDGGCWGHAEGRLLSITLPSEHPAAGEIFLRANATLCRIIGSRPKSGMKLYFKTVTRAGGKEKKKERKKENESSTLPPLPCNTQCTISEYVCSESQIQPYRQQSGVHLLTPLPSPVFAFPSGRAGAQWK